MAKPKIRFNGYTEDWEQRKFGEIVEKYEDPVETPTEGYTRLGIRSHAKGTFHSYVEKGKELETAKMFRVAADKFIVNITFGWEHAVAITDENDAGKLVSHRFPQYSFNAGMEPKFFRYLILDENFKHHLELSSPGGAGRNRVLKLSDMLQYKMNFPSEAEQKKIAAYFDDLDHLITLHQRKCEQTKTLKKYMLQKMFPQDGEKVPQIRFEGFTEDWEQRKLGEVIEGVSKKNANGLYTQDDILACSLGTELDRKTIFYGLRSTEDSVKSYRIVNIGNVIYTKSPIKGYPNGIVRTCKIVDGIVPSLYCVYKKKENISIPIDTRFIQSYLEDKGRLDQYLCPLVNVGARNNVNITDKEFLEGIIKIPTTVEEQAKIVDVLEKINHLITLHQRKCDELKEVKKFMLQNMFV